VSGSASQEAQDHNILPAIYSLHYLERVIDKIQGTGTGIAVHGNRINNLRFADNIDLIEGQIKTNEENVEILRRERKTEIKPKIH